MFVLAVTMLRELYDDIKRYLRDKEVNGQKYIKLTPTGTLAYTGRELNMAYWQFSMKPPIKFFQYFSYVLL